jgi:paraquat-inducible protein B
MSMLVGGIAFETPATVTVAMDVPEDMVFELYPNKQATRQPRYSQQARYLLYFDGSVSGLVPGSPVEFRGIKVGEVLSVDINFDTQTNEVQIPVVIEIEPERLGITQKKLYRKDVPRIASLVGRGLRARLVTNNVLTGKKAISFEFISDAEPVAIVFGEAYPILPTVSGGLDAITQRVARILDRVEKLPIESIGNNLNEAFANLSQTLQSVDNLTNSANANLLPQLTASLVKLEETLASADAMIAPDSAMAIELKSMMSDLAGAAQSLRLLAQRLEEHPEELLRGKGE